MNQVLEDFPDYEKFKDILVWRCISAHRRHGHWEYLFDDYVLETHLGTYLEETSKRGAERITLHLFAKFKYAFDSSVRKPMRGTISLSKERHLGNLEAWL